MSKDLTVKALKDAFGKEYDTINKLTKDKPDSYIFRSWNLVNLEDFFVSVLWGRDDIRNRLEFREGYKQPTVSPTDKNVNRIFEELQMNDENDWINESDSLFDMIEEDIDNTIEELLETKEIS